ncbi:hypothetical protein CRM22_011374 [Opisthorchis felineus]|uniref:Uncharacterized protein n=1 Tax=Opisthorchis felineus TaxID=147828 RepID=A0A4S2JL65_OPIFE|nr:hypothetical protein CRM22_011374 [Opisthorchis felineus]
MAVIDRPFSATVRLVIPASSIGSEKASSLPDFFTIILDSDCATFSECILPKKVLLNYLNRTSRATQDSLTFGVFQRFLLNKSVTVVLKKNIYDFYPHVVSMVPDTPRTRQSDISTTDWSSVTHPPNELDYHSSPHGSQPLQDTLFSSPSFSEENQLFMLHQSSPFMITPTPMKHRNISVQPRTQH